MPDEGAQIPVEVLQKSQLMDELYKDPKTRGALLNQIKTKYPDVRIPELEVEDRFGTLRKEIDDERTKWKEERAQERAEAKREKDLAAMRAKGVSEAEVPEVEKLMTEGQIGDPAIAAEVFVARRSAAAPRSAPSFTFDLPDQKELFGTATQRKNWARKMAATTLHEMRTGR